MEERGVRLRRAAQGSGSDWVDEHGRTYDAVGPFPGRFFDAQWKSFSRQIEWHLAKTDLVPVDVSMFDRQQTARVQDFTARFGSRVFIVGRKDD